MSTTQRKARETKQRELQILAAARQLLLERGYLGLTMDRVAEKIEYSKGTVYQHFGSKEDLLAALEVQTMDERIAMFQRAATFSGRPRERLAAIGIAEELFVQLKPEHFRCSQIINSGAFQAKMDEKTVSGIRSREMRCSETVEGILRDAIAQGDLKLPEGMGPSELSLTLWSLYIGFFTLVEGSIPFDQFGVQDPIAMLRRSSHLLLDGYGFQPLFGDWDWAAASERILSEVFPDEHQALLSR